MSQPAQQQDPAVLKDQFLKAEAQVNDGRVQVPESLKFKLYGLGKQVMVGDCKMPQPPATNEILRAKWDAWTSVSGMPVEAAMKDYVSIVEGLEPGVKAPMEKRQSMKFAVDQPGGIKKKGKLYKQRDYYKNWKARHFVLQDCYLHYYLDADEPVPRNTLDLTGCSVSSSKSIVVDGVEYFPFTISHPRTKLTYNLSSDSKLDADIWIAKILEAATANNFTNAAVVETTEAPEPEPAVAAGPGSFNVTKITNHSQETRSFLPPDVGQKLERVAQQTLDALDDKAPGWEPLLDKNGLVAKKKNAPGQIHIKAEMEYPYSTFDVFRLITDINRQLEMDPTRAIHDRLKDISMHSWVDYIQAKGLWPTSPRDFVNFVNWRLLNTGQVLFVSFSDPVYAELKGLRDGIIRGDMIVAAFLLTPVAAGTKLQYLLHLDLKGTIPATVVNLALGQQASALINIRKVLDSDKKKATPMKDVSYTTNYSELVSLMANEDGSTSAAPSTASGKAVPPAAANHRKAALIKVANRSMKISKMSMTVLLLPTLLYVVVEPGLRAAAFLAGLMIAYTYLLHRHLGQSKPKTSKHFELQMPTGRLVMRFPVELGKLLVYLDNKRADSELEVTFTHVVVKACALVLLEMPSLNGHVIASTFFPTKSLGVDLSVSLDINSKETVAIKVCDADAKPLELIADEILNAGKTLRNGGHLEHQPGQFFDKLDSILPGFLSVVVKRVLYTLGAKIGISVPQLGIVPYPLGVCTVINSPNMDREDDMDLSIVSDVGDAFAPITVTMSGMRLHPSIDGDRKISGAPVLNFSVSMSTYAASMTEMRRFCARLQEYLNDPNKIDKVHLKAEFDRQEAAKRRLFFGKKDT